MLLLTRSTTIATKETLKIIRVLTAPSYRYIKMHCELTALDCGKLKAGLCCNALTRFVFWVSNSIFEMCMQTNRCKTSVPRGLRTVLDWWHANENNNLSSPSLTHRPCFCHFSFNYGMINVLIVDMSGIQVPANLVSLSLQRTTLISNLDEWKQ